MPNPFQVLTKEQRPEVVSAPVTTKKEAPEMNANLPEAEGARRNKHKANRYRDNKRKGQDRKSGTGRPIKGRTRRDNRGKFNSGNPLDDVNNTTPGLEDQSNYVEEEPQPQGVSFSSFMGASGSGAKVPRRVSGGLKLKVKEDLEPVSTQSTKVRATTDESVDDELADKMFSFKDDRPRRDNNKRDGRRDNRGGKRRPRE
ncbi:hypothetical protein PCE1_004632 [Barthelona sp. PCE]